MLTPNDVQNWAVVTGRVFQPAIYKLTPKPPCRLERNFTFTLSDGVAYGPMTYAEAQELCEQLCGDVTLCILPGNGLQAIWLTGLSLREVDEQIDQLPGMMVFPDDGDGILLMGYGEPFPGIHRLDVIASCEPGVLFPIGQPWCKPIYNNRGQNLRWNMEWSPPEIKTLENLKPLADFLAALNLTAQDYEKFRTDEIEHEAKRREEMAERMEACKGLDFSNGPILLKDAAATKRELLP